MSLEVNFAGKKVIEPGVYAQTKGAVSNQSASFPFGDVLLIDTGSNAGFGGGSGINGKNSNGIDSVYSFENLSDFKSFLTGGLFWDIADLIFNPAIGAPSPSRVYYARAAQTVPAVIDLQLTNGSLVIEAKNEGTVGNGLLDEKRATSIVRIDHSLITNVLEVSVTIDSTIIFTGVPGVTDPAAFKQAIAEGINSSGSGYTARVRGLDIIVSAPIGTGASANALTISVTGDPSITNTFSGGENGTKLIKGYALELLASDIDPDKYVIRILRGSYSGESKEGYIYGEKSISSVKPELIAESDEFSTISELITWAQEDINFKKSFNILSTSLTSDGSVTQTDLDNFELLLATGGSENYRPEDLDSLLDEITELGNTFFLCDKYGKEAKSAENLKILDHILNHSEFDKFMVVGAGADENQFKDGENSSLEVAKFYDSARVITVHSGALVENSSGDEFLMPSIYTAANVIGRLGGLEPQEPLTYKNLKLSNFAHKMNKKEREQALKGGVVHMRFVPNIGEVVNQGINTIQNKRQEITPNGDSYEISIMSIGAQINKELILNMRPLFIGSNRGRVSEADIKAFVEGYLFRITSRPDANNMIIRFENVIVTLEEGDYNVSYKYVPNGPINRIFTTGFKLPTNA